MTDAGPAPLSSPPGLETPSPVGMMSPISPFLKPPVKDGHSDQAQGRSPQGVASATPRTRRPFGLNSQSSAGALLAVLYAEFDNLLGPTLRHQSPPGFITAGQFEQLSKYIMPKAELVGRLVAVRSSGVVVLGCPMAITDNKYHRNALLFNVCMVLEGSFDLNHFELAVQKLNHQFREMEVESGVLHQGAEVPRIVKEIYEGIKRSGKCEVHIENTIISLKVGLPYDLPQGHSPPAPAEYQVPVLLGNLSGLVKEDWDLTLQHVLPYVDGVRHIKAIAAESGVASILVRECMRLLVWYDLAAVTDKFQYSNVYAVAPGVSVLGSNQTLQRLCLESCLLRQGMEQPPFRRVFSVLCAFQQGLTVGEICRLRDPRGLNLDIRKLVTFAVIHGVLRRVHCFPFYLGPREPGAAGQALGGGGGGGGEEEEPLEERGEQPPGASAGAAAADDAGGSEVAGAPVLAALDEVDLRPLLDGRHHFDEICCKLEISAKQLWNHLKRFNVSFLWK
jgi:hypothetical protein